MILIVAEIIQKGLTINLHDLDVKVVSDEKWLLVIIEQVLSNSLKYTKSGGIDIYFKDNGCILKILGLVLKIVIFYGFLSVAFQVIMAD